MIWRTHTTDVTVEANPGEDLSRVVRCPPLEDICTVDYDVNNCICAADDETERNAANTVQVLIVQMMDSGSKHNTQNNR